MAIQQMMLGSGGEASDIIWSNLVLYLDAGKTNSYSGSGTTASTGGGIYKVAVQQFQFSQMPAMEDRWTFSIQFVSQWREGIS